MIVNFNPFFPQLISSNRSYIQANLHSKYPCILIKLFLLQAREEGKGGLFYIQISGNYLDTMATRQKNT